MAPTYLETLSAFTSFLTAYTHTLLYLRSLYPRTSFAQSRFHNTSVFQSRHPLVCEWIQDAVAAVREELLEGTVSRIGIVVFSCGNGETGKTGSAKIMERYMFDVSTFPVVGKNERNMEIEWDYNSSDDAGNDSDVSNPAVKKKGKQKELDVDVDTNLSEQFRAALIVLTSRTSQLSPLPPNCSFNISMELKDEGDVDPPIRHPQPWIPVQPSLQKTGRKATVRDEDEEEEVQKGRGKAIAEGNDLGGVKVTPIRSVEAGVFRFETWVEEGKAKFESQDKDSTKTSFASSIG
jgi:mitotic spindle assembly checkpoint protein MAD2B